MSAHLRRAFDLTESQADAPMVAKLEALRVEGQDAQAFLSRVQNSPLIAKAVSEAIDILSSMATDRPDLAESPEELQGVRMVIATLTAAAENDNEFVAWKAFMNAIAVLAAMEGFVLGVAYRQERGKADLEAARHRPKR
jgi:hypothetical protein